MPTFAICALEGRPVPVYGEGGQRREFLYVTDWAGAALTVLDHGEPVASTTSATGTSSKTWSCAAHLRAAGAPESQIAFVADRPGHDFRYGLQPDVARWAGGRRCRSTTGSR